MLPVKPLAQWLVTQGDQQFSVDGMARLKSLAQQGKLAPGDMIQPPGSTEWVYASEVPELRKLIEQHHQAEEPKRTSAVNPIVLGLFAVSFVAILGFGAFGMFVYANELSKEQSGILGEKGLTFTEMIVTNEGVSLMDDASAGARSVASLPKDDVLHLIAKRGDYYKARTRAAVEGWVRVDQVVAMYQYGGAEVRREFDPLYNPDRYLEVSNASWTELPDKVEGTVTVFRFQLENPTKYDMTELVLRATIKDGQGREMEKVEFKVEGFVPANATAMVGTLAPEGDKRTAQDDPEAEQARVLTDYSFAELAAEDPELQLRFSDGVEVALQAGDFVSAQIDVVELRAVPK